MNKTIRRTQRKFRLSQLFVVVLAAATLAGCTAKVDGDAAIKSADIPAFKSEAAKKSAEAAAEAQAQRTKSGCRSLQPKTDAALKAYNAFIARLNATQSIDASRQQFDGALAAITTATDDAERLRGEDVVDALSMALPGVIRTGRALLATMKSNPPPDKINGDADKWVDELRRVDIGCLLYR